MSKVIKKADIFDQQVSEYEAWYDRYPHVYASELKTLRAGFRRVPEDPTGIEVGMGTGRFSAALGIREGVEPSEPMAARARKRGIEVMKAKAERLPYGDLRFDFVLFVTVCHLDNLDEALREAHRVLKPKGVLIIGFLDAEREVAAAYMDRRKESTFFRYARFYPVSELSRHLVESGFKDLEYHQSLFGGLDDIQSSELPEKGHGKGSFVVVSALKK